jgi:hypothetical protein
MPPLDYLGSATKLDYPFSPGSSLSALFEDFYLSYLDGGFVPPFILIYAHGFGTLSSSAIAPAPTHTQDIVVIDSGGLIVFDSTLAITFKTTAWGLRQIVQWTNADSVLRIVYRTTQAGNFATYLHVPTATLDARTCNRLPGRVRTITVNDVVMRGNISLVAGYNIALSGTAGSGQDGGRFKSLLALDGVIGDGAGIAPGCEATVTTLQTINGIQPTADGSFTIQADGCFRAQLPITVSSGTATYGTESLSSENAQAAIAIYSDCQPCCPNDYYARTYLGIQNVWNTWAALASQAETARNTYRSNIARWNAQLACRLASNLKVVAIQNTSCMGFFGALYCNMSPCCLTDVTFRFTFQLFINGVLNTAPIPATITGATIQSSSTTGEEQYAPNAYINLAGLAVYEADAGSLNPRSNAVAKIQIKTACDSTWSLRCTVTVHVATPAIGPDHSICVLPTPAIPSDITAIWTATGVPSTPANAILMRTIPLSPTVVAFGCGA